jgi:hypothetical protein
VESGKFILLRVLEIIREFVVKLQVNNCHFRGIALKKEREEKQEAD